MNEDLLEWWDGTARDVAENPAVSVAHRKKAKPTHSRSRSHPFPSQAAAPPRPGSARTHRRQHGHSRQPPASAADIAASANRRANRAVPRKHVRAASSPSASANWTRPLTLDDLVGLGVYGLDNAGAPARANGHAVGARTGAHSALDAGDERENTSRMMKQLQDSRRRVQKTHQAAKVVRARHAAIFPRSGEWQR